MHGRFSPTTIIFLGQFAVEAFALPMVGTRICAGFPSPADDFLDEEVDLVRILTPNRAASFLWRVSGHSMTEAGVHDGDVVVVDRSVSPKHGDVVVATIDGETSLKLYRDHGRPGLAFANRTMPVLEIGEAADVEIWGVVSWSLHRPRLP